MKERLVVNRTRNAREFADHLERKLHQKVRHLNRKAEREAKELRMLLGAEEAR